MEFSAIFLIAMPISTFLLVSVLMSPTVTLIYALRKFETFSSVVTIFDVEPESVLNFLL